jgi:hypothetical protein
LIAPETREVVRERALDRCEYCGLPQAVDPFLRFHVEHIIPRQHGGADELDNLALACHHCNLHKGPNLAGLDPVTGRLTPLYHPRLHQWSEHFALEAEWILALTAIGRVTVYVLAMNADEQRRLRAATL